MKVLAWLLEPTFGASAHHMIVDNGRYRDCTRGQHRGNRVQARYASRACLPQTSPTPDRRRTRGTSE
jgi:hypothetical protein